MTTKKGLGRGMNSLGKGMGSLIGDSSGDVSLENNDESQVKQVDINKITPNKKQPRKNFSQSSLEELADSIREMGIIQPITVLKKDDQYEIIAGERRWRAARIAQLEEVPVIIKDYIIVIHL